MSRMSCRWLLIASLGLVLSCVEPIPLQQPASSTPSGDTSDGIPSTKPERPKNCPEGYFGQENAAFGAVCFG